MNRTVSLYLDLLRLLAAVAVLLGHAHGYILSEIPKFIASHSAEGVAVFFVLSGFVISYVSEVKGGGWKVFAFDRFVRIFSVVPISLVVTFFADRVGVFYNEPYYEEIPWFNTDYISGFLASISFTNELWGVQTTFGSNHAYWSLGFEVQYYIAFGLAVFLPRPWKFLALAIWGIFVGPLIAVYFLLWGVGHITYRAVRRPRSESFLFPIGCFLASILGYVFVKLTFSDFKSGIPYVMPMREFFANFSYFMTVGLLVALNIASVARMPALPERWHAAWEPPIRWLAGGSFSLYLVHEPLLALSAAVLPQGDTRTVWAVAALFGIVAFCFAAAELGERRKNAYRRVYSALILHSFRKN